MKHRLLHHLTATVFVKPHDDEQHLLAGLDQLSPIPTRELLAAPVEHDHERPHTTHQTVKDTTLTIQEVGIDEGRMRIISLHTKRMHACTMLVEKFAVALTDDERTAIMDDPHSVLDEDLHLSFRLDKELLPQGKFVLVADGQCYAIKAAIAAYPKHEDTILAAVRTMLDRCT
jgi:RNA binding exosome subunit